MFKVAVMHITKYSIARSQKLPYWSAYGRADPYGGLAKDGDHPRIWGSSDDDSSKRPERLWWRLSL